jgi:branched-chain amino acid transport system permease protein
VKALIEEILVSTFILGGLYCLLALGFSLIRGVARVMNLAHGGFYVLTSYFIYSLVFGGLGIAIPISLISIIIVSLVVYKLLIGPMHEKDMGAAVVTLGLVLMLQEVIKLVYGPEIKSIPYLITGYVTILGVRVVSQKLLAGITAIVLVAVLMIFIRRTKQGRAIRAVAQNMEVARLVGINIPRVVMMSMGISALLAGLAAVLFAPVYMVDPTQWTILFRAFPVIILGGLGSLKGMLVASFMIAGIEMILAFTIGGGYIVSTITFFVMLMVLFVRPEGLFGHTTK